MKTSVVEIYEMFLSKIEDELFALMGESLARKQMYMYLLNSTTRFSTCKKDLSIEGNVFGEKEISSGTTDIVINELETEPNIELYTEVNELVLEKDYTYEYSEEDKTLTINIISEINMPIIVEYFIDGSFKEELTLLEKRILATGMVLEWIIPRVNREDNLRQRVTNKEFKKLSNATLLDKLIKMEEHRSSEYKNLIIDYTYRDFKGFN